MPKPRGQQQSQGNQQVRRSHRFNQSIQKSTTAEEQGEGPSSRGGNGGIDVEMKGETPTKRPDDKKTCLAYEERCMEHKWRKSLPNPERPERIQRFYERLKTEGLVDRCIRVPSRKATIDEVTLVHDAAYIREFETTQRMAAIELSKWQRRWNSINACPRTWDAALLACGNLLECVDAVVDGRATNGAAVIRPPGHHAESNGAYGFCFINNVAVAAKYAQTRWGVGKILILDWDVHHGNGIQSAFYTDPTVLYMSLHRYDHGTFFPCNNGNQGNYTDVGDGAGRGFNINVPWDGEGMGDGEYLEAFEKVIMPIAHEFEPELVLVSAGFDAARGDPLGEYLVTPHGYARMTQMLSTLANGRIVLALEGGYNLTSISDSMAACVRVLLGEHPVEQDEEPKPCSTAAQNKLVTIESFLGKFWKCVGHKLLDESASEDNRRALVADANGRRTEEEAEEVPKSRTDGKKKKAQNKSALASDTNVVEKARIDGKKKNAQSKVNVLTDASVVYEYEPKNKRSVAQSSNRATSPSSKSGQIAVASVAGMHRLDAELATGDRRATGKGGLLEWTKIRKTYNASMEVEDWKRRKSELRALDERISKVEMLYAALRDEADRRVADNEKIVAKVRDDNDAVEAARSKVADVRSKLAYLRKERVRAVEEEHAAVEKCVRDKVLDSLLEGLDD